MKEYLMQQIIPVLFASVNKIKVNGDAAFAQITTRQFMTLITMAHMEETECTQNRIAEQMGTTKQNASQLLDSLHKRGMIEFKENPQDRRSKLVVMTEQGKQIGMESMLAANRMIGDMMKDFTEDELKELWRLLLKLFAYDGVEMEALHHEHEHED